MKNKIGVLSGALAVAVLFSGCGKSNMDDSQTESLRRGVSSKISRGREEINLSPPVRRVLVGKGFDIKDLGVQLDLGVSDPGAKSQYYLKNTNAYKVWDDVEQEEEITVAVVDTGVDYTHEDLKDRVVKELGYDFVNDDDDAMDDNGHGTHVSGIIAAEGNNEKGIIGVVGELDVRIMPVKVLNKDGKGNSENIAKGIRYATDNGADVINLSLGGNNKSGEIKKAIDYAIEKDVIVISAAGNEKENADDSVPAGVDGVITVAATNVIGTAASFSNYGECIDISAPGTKILSTVLEDGYEAWDGTSMAAPLVSGVVAMLKAENISLSQSEVIDILNKSAKDILVKGEDMRSGSGIIDAEKALQILREK